MPTRKTLLFVFVWLYLIAGFAGAQTTITFWDNQQSESGLSDFQKTAIEEFEAANPDIQVEVVTIPYAEYQQRLLLAIQSGNPPDVSTVDQIWNAAFAASGALAPLDTYVEGSESVLEKNFFTGAWESAQYDEQTYGIPFNVDVWQFTFYNSALLEDAGVKPASLSTWEGLRAAGEKLTDTASGQFGIGLFGAIGEDSVVVVDSFIYSNGGSVLADDGSCALDEPAAVEALSYLQDLAQFAPQGILNASSGDMRELFLNGSLATEFWPALEQPTLQRSEIEWNFVAGTAPEGKTPIGAYGGWNLVVYENSPEKEAAWRFIEFLTQPDVNGRVVDLIPANIEAADAFLRENRKGAEQILEHLNNARPRPLSPNYLEVSSIQQEMIQAIFSATPVEDAAAAACEAIDSL